MKILITSDWYLPAVNGVVTSVKNLRRELEARGHEVRVLTLSQNRHSCRKDGVTCLGSVAAGLIYPGARLRTALAGKWVREIVEWGPDVVHSQCEFSTFFLARRIAEELDIPLVHTYHTVYEDYTHYFSPNVRFGKKAAAVFTRWAASHTDCLIAPTAKVRLLLQGYGVKGLQMGPVPLPALQAQLRRPGKAHDLGRGLGAGAEAPLLPPARQKGPGIPHPGADVQGPDALGPADLVGGNRYKIRPQGPGGEGPQALHRVGVEEGLGISGGKAPGDVRNGVHGPQLVVHQHDGDGGGVGPDGL